MSNEQVNGSNPSPLLVPLAKHLTLITPNWADNALMTEAPISVGISEGEAIVVLPFGARLVLLVDVGLNLSEKIIIVNGRFKYCMHIDTHLVIHRPSRTWFHLYIWL